MELQYNLKTLIPYEGGNQAALLAEKERNGYKSDSWATFLQCKGMNKRLVNAKGKGVHLRAFGKTTDEEGEPISVPKWFVVFNKDLMKDVEVVNE